MTPLLNAAPTVTGPGNPGAASYAAGYVPANEAWLASFRRPRNGLALGGGSAAPSQPAAPVASPAAAWDTLRRMAMGGGRDEANSLVRDRAGMLGSERWTTPDWQGSFGSWAANALSGAMMPFGGVLAPAALVGTTGTQRPRGAFERLTDWALGRDDNDQRDLSDQRAYDDALARGDIQVNAGNLY